MDTKRRIQVLERCFEIMEEVIRNGYVTDGEKQTRKNFETILAEKRKSLNTDIDKEAILEVYTKLDNLTYIELGELYEIITAD